MSSIATTGFNRGDIVEGCIGSWEVRDPNIGDNGACLVMEADHYAKLVPKVQGLEDLRSEASGNERWGILVAVSPEELAARLKLGTTLGIPLLDRGEDWSWVIEVDTSALRPPAVASPNRSLFPLAALASQTEIPLGYLSHGHGFDAPSPWADVAPTGRLLAEQGKPTARDRINLYVNPVSGFQSILGGEDRTPQQLASGLAFDVHEESLKPFSINATGHSGGCPQVVSSVLAAHRPNTTLTDMLASTEILVSKTMHGSKLAAQWASAGFSVVLLPAPKAQRFSVKVPSRKCMCTQGRGSAVFLADELIRGVYGDAMPIVSEKLSQDLATLIAADVLMSETAGLVGQPDSARMTEELRGFAEDLCDVPTQQLHAHRLPGPVNFRDQDSLFAAGVTLVGAIAQYRLWAFPFEVESDLESDLEAGRSSARRECDIIFPGIRRAVVRGFISRQMERRLGEEANRRLGGSSLGNQKSHFMNRPLHAAQIDAAIDKVRETAYDSYISTAAKLGYRLSISTDK